MGGPSHHANRPSKGERCAYKRAQSSAGRWERDFFMCCAPVFTRDELSSRARRIAVSGTGEICAFLSASGRPYVDRLHMCPLSGFGAQRAPSVRPVLGNTEGLAPFVPYRALTKDRFLFRNEVRGCTAASLSLSPSMKSSDHTATIYLGFQSCTAFTSSGSTEPVRGSSTSKTSPFSPPTPPSLLTTSLPPHPLLYSRASSSPRLTPLSQRLTPISQRTQCGVFSGLESERYPSAFLAVRRIASPLPQPLSLSPRGAANPTVDKFNPMVTFFTAIRCVDGRATRSDAFRKRGSEGRNREIGTYRFVLRGKRRTISHLLSRSHAKLLNLARLPLMRDRGEEDFHSSSVDRSPVCLDKDAKLV